MNDDKSEKLWIMGNFCETNQEARLIHTSTIWFTYRENLVFDNSQITSDVGWGCMLRVGQMMMAEALRRTIGLDLYADRTIITKTIEAFMKNDGVFSIQKMVKLSL
jgi:cysteine protease ATG4